MKTQNSVYNINPIPVIYHKGSYKNRGFVRRTRGLRPPQGRSVQLLADCGRQPLDPDPDIVALLGFDENPDLILGA